jgi:hypothetical protein
MLSTHEHFPETLITVKMQAGPDGPSRVTARSYHILGATISLSKKIETNWYLKAHATLASGIRKAGTREGICHCTTAPNGLES